MLGRDVMRAAERHRHAVVGLPRARLDITDGPAVEGAMNQHRPDAVINCAAWTDVDGAEAHEDEATRANSEAAGIVAGAAEGVGAKLIHPSSDYVFDGSKTSPYVESDHPAPISAYGRSKLGGETAVSVANKKHFIVRSAWLFGVGGKNFVETMLTMAAEQPEVVVVSDQVGSPTYTGHLGDALVRLADRDDYGIHHIAAAGSCSWFEFAQEIFDQAGVECRVMGGTTEMLGRPAPRPPYSVLGTELDDPIALPSWRKGLAAYLAERQQLGDREEAVA
jgi:dTDP-4-dehydrorhamnose reductase